jgi:hypothetical protein
MIKHRMHVQRDVTQFLNPGQITVTTFDQPIFVLTKYVHTVKMVLEEKRNK